MKPKKNLLTFGNEYLSLGFLLPCSIFVGYAVGYWLDKSFHTKFLTLTFLLLGILGGFIQVLRVVNKDTEALAKDDSLSKDDKSDGG